MTPGSRVPRSSPSPASARNPLRSRGEMRLRRASHVLPGTVEVDASPALRTRGSDTIIDRAQPHGNAYRRNATTPRWSGLVSCRRLLPALPHHRRPTQRGGGGCGDDGEASARSIRRGDADQALRGRVAALAGETSSGSAPCFLCLHLGPVRRKVDRDATRERVRSCYRAITADLGGSLTMRDDGPPPGARFGAEAGSVAEAWSAAPDVRTVADRDRARGDCFGRRRGRALVGADASTSIPFGAPTR